jgi:hypothetical protein
MYNIHKPNTDTKNDPNRFKKDRHPYNTCLLDRRWDDFDNPIKNEQEIAARANPIGLWEEIH